MILYVNLNIELIKIRLNLKIWFHSCTSYIHSEHSIAHVTRGYRVRQCKSRTRALKLWNISAFYIWIQNTELHEHMCFTWPQESIFSLVKFSCVCLNNHVCGTVTSKVDRLHPSGGCKNVCGRGSEMIVAGFISQDRLGFASGTKNPKMLVLYPMKVYFSHVLHIWPGLVKGGSGEMGRFSLRPSSWSSPTKQLLPGILLATKVEQKSTLDSLITK